MLSNSRLLTIVNLPLAASAGWLLWRSLDWPLVGDATVFHFIASQMRMGAVPYRDILDMNMPLTYGIHAVVVEIGGMSDAAWRLFDLTAAAVLSALIVLLAGSVGRAAAILALLLVLITHLSLGAYSAGQRDFIMSIPAVAVAWASARAADVRRRRWLYLFAAGAFAMTAASIKPSGILLLFLPLLAVTRSDWRDLTWTAVGAVGVGLLVLGWLAAYDGLNAFVSMTRVLLPQYASLNAQPIFRVLMAVKWLAPIGGLALAAALGLTASKPPAVRMMIALTAFGLVHLLVQQKGWYYHVYPLGVGLACWGAWSLAVLPVGRAIVCVIVLAWSVGWSVWQALDRIEDYPSLRAASAMQSALENRLPHGARVQVLDSDHGAFLAMARSGMRQATPHLHWFSLIVADDRVRSDFLAALKASPPAAMLLTNDQWPRGRGFNAVDDWSDFRMLLTAHYDLDLVGHDDQISWRLYLRKAASSSTSAGSSTASRSLTDERL